ncbi:MFS transporter [Rubrobacter marinus]|uniref:MFS transporter n=1 Tax=Rubrobacter marinus TaxID=2653852 RepID=A0A6G8PUF0_9ACTN|nr:MFS transporter [Rubrobacter marinus]QIN77626.1 MFS transporter [Rubrobacter marinus]
MSVGGEKRDYRGWALALLCAAQFVDVLDVNVVIVALPSIGRDLGFSQGDLQWVVTAYVLFFAGFLLLAGRMADLFGRRRMFVVGMSLFASASLVCGFAGSPLVLVVARAAQGLGAAITAPAALSIITGLYDEGPLRNRALAVWTAVAAGGGAAGLVLGGLLTDGLGWEWAFFVNVPVGISAVALAPLLLPGDRGAATTRRLGAPGAVVATGGLVLLVYGLTRVEEEGVGSPLTLGVLALAAALVPAFVLVERRVADPLVPLETFRVRNLVGANLVAFVNTATSSPTGVLLALYLQGVLGRSSTFTGLVFLPFSVAVILGSFAGSRLVDRLGARFSAASGLLVMAVSSLVSAGISAGGGVGYVLGGSVLGGLGLGCSAVAATAAGTAVLGRGEQGLASGLLNTAAQVGTALGVAALVTLAVARAGALAGDGPATAAAIVEGYRWAFYASSGLAVLGALVAVFVVNERKGEA